jgi:enoyl-CoA hydratase/carnithine racemase
MPGGPVVFEEKDGVGFVTLNRPEAGNRVNADVAAELRRIAAEVGYGSTVKVVVLSGIGFFSLGADPEARSALDDPRKVVETLGAASALAEIGQPTIAAISGDALGQGLELAMACDFRIASQTARLGLDQVEQGELPWDGGTQRLPRLIGRARALDMILTGRVLSAEEAVQAGLIHRAVPPEALDETVRGLALDLAAKAPVALRYAKEAVLSGLDLTLSQGLRLEADLYFLIHTTRDRTEGITAFREKRKPRFEGR